MHAYFEQTMGFYNFAWIMMAAAALWLPSGIHERLKALHAIELARFKSERPDVFAD